MTAYIGNKLDNRYKVWAGLRQRCDNPNDQKYKNYGARGITYDPVWNDFKVFCADVGPRPAGTSIDRYPDNDGNYEKCNVRWATVEQQANNRRLRKLPAKALPNSGTGILGVSQRSKDGYYKAQGKRHGQTYQLYEGPSLEEAVKCRKAWEESFA